MCVKVQFELALDISIYIIWDSYSILGSFSFAVTVIVTCYVLYSSLNLSYKLFFLVIFCALFCKHSILIFKTQLTNQRLVKHDYKLHNTFPVSRDSIAYYTICVAIFVICLNLILHIYKCTYRFGKFYF